MKFRASLILLLFCFGTGTVMANNGNTRDTVRYEIKMHNNTQGQWFSPVLCVLHSKKVRLFRRGKSATTGLAIFAEDGLNAVLAEELRQSRHVYAVLEGAAGLTPPGATRVEEIRGPKRARLSCAAMPVTTNDVLTAISNVRPPRFYGATKYYDSTEWNIGSEEDNYSATMALDSLRLAPEGPDNPVTISENVFFGPLGRPDGVPTAIGPFVRSFFGVNGVTAEVTMDIFDGFIGSERYPASLYGWQGPASSFTVTRID